MPSNVLRIGNVDITAIIDAEASAPPSVLFPSVAADDWAPYHHLLADDGKTMKLTISAHLVRSGAKTILIDTGIGAKDRAMFPNGRLPDALREAGVKPEDVDIVVATHLHVDHVGWHTTAEGDGCRPTFPRAEIIFNREEWEFFTEPVQAAKPDMHYIRDCVLPLKDSPRLQLVDGEHKITDELVMLPTPGHTPAHVSIGIASAGEAGIIIGDVCHHPAQLMQTGWSPVFDMNPVLSAETREKLVQRIERERLAVAGGHFAHPGFGRVVQVEGRRTWRAL